MKKVFLVLLILLTSVGVCLAAPKWVPRQYYDSDQQITTARTVIYDFSIYYTGVTKGDKIVLRNGTSTSATAFYTFIAEATDGVTPLVDPAKDIVVDRGLYFDVSRTGGALGINITYQ